MRIAVLKERHSNETRVAANPEIVKKYNSLGFSVAVESGAGLGSQFLDDDYAKQGAVICQNLEETLKDANLVLHVRAPESGLHHYPKGSLLVWFSGPIDRPESFHEFARHNLTTFGLEFIPRISRAQSMDALSSQSNLAGYKAVLDAASEFSRAFPMMMTAAGTIPPARVLVLGAGVAGLQAIATARRLGAIVSAFDVRPAAKEQVESLGAHFVEIEGESQNAETKGGYANEMTEDYKRRQAEKLADTIKTMDIVICTALIPGKKAPILVTEDMVKTMKPGSVIVDLAVERGGNCPLSEANKVVTKHNVKLVGHLNVPGRLASDASRLYARNMFHFVELLWNKETKSLNIDLGDPIVEATLMTKDGHVIPEAFGGIKKNPSKQSQPSEEVDSLKEVEVQAEDVEILPPEEGPKDPNDKDSLQGRLRA